ncbi:MAG: aspartate kinase [Candidatus Izemoplasma sp.]|nr:aspartate kinase [Candidatus Izemoplasma sp.]
MKYGGTSVGTIEQLNNIVDYVKIRKKEDKDIVLVVSAMGKQTDHLLSLAKTITSSIDKREMDTLLATGEQQTIALLTIALKSAQVDAISLTGFQAGVKTTSSHTKGIIMDVDISRVTQHLKENKVVVVAGFQGITETGDISTLGRGGSDTSAVALAAKLGFPCEIYTDVSGIYRVDPRRYKDAKKLDHISYDELMEMSSLGAGVIETRSVELAKKYNVPLYIAKSLSKKGSGTTIMNQSYMFEEKPITGLSVTDNVVMVTLENIENNLTTVTDVFNHLSANNINLDMISQTVDKHNQLVISFSIDGHDLDALYDTIESEKLLFKSVKYNVTTELVKLSLVGVGMASHFGVAAKVFHLLAKENITFTTVSTSEISISCTISQKDQAKAIQTLANGFGL